ncbi:MAG: 4Fe-4S dicluster domain-containing protein [Thermodesulfobacteriota bacterium]
MTRIVFDPDSCKGCLICVAMCPKKVLALSGSRNVKGYLVPEAVRSRDCAGCRTCEKICPDMAVYLLEETP